LLACGSAPVSATSVASVDPDPQQNTASSPLPAHSLWSGRYRCAQGVTGLTLTLDVAGDRATAVFDFGAIPENPTVPTGRYLLDGVIAIGSATALRLVPDRWIVQPSGYMMVGFSAEIDRSARTMRGTIEEPSCGALELTRVR
jgi:hypothetical protein